MFNILIGQILVTELLIVAVYKCCLYDTWFWPYEALRRTIETLQYPRNNCLQLQVTELLFTATSKIWVHFSYNQSTSKQLLAWWFYISKHRNQDLYDSLVLFLFPGYKTASVAPTSGITSTFQARETESRVGQHQSRSKLSKLHPLTQQMFAYTSWGRAQCWEPEEKSIWL